LNLSPSNALSFGTQVNPTRLVHQAPSCYHVWKSTKTLNWLRLHCGARTSEWNGIEIAVKTPEDVDLPRNALQPASPEVETIASKGGGNRYLYPSHYSTYTIPYTIV